MIGKRIQTLRKLKGLTQDELARKANLPYTTLAKIEGGTVANPRIMTITKIACALDITIDKMLRENHT